MKRLYNRIARLAAKKNWSVSRVARESGVKADTIFTWKNTKTPKWKNLEKVAKVLDTTPEILMYGYKASKCKAKRQSDNTSNNRDDNPEANRKGVAN